MDVSLRQQVLQLVLIPIQQLPSGEEKNSPRSPNSVKQEMLYATFNVHMANMQRFMKSSEESEGLRNMKSSEECEGLRNKIADLRTVMDAQIFLMNERQRRKRKK